MLEGGVLGNDLMGHIVFSFLFTTMEVLPLFGKRCQCDKLIYTQCDLLEMGHQLG